MTENRQIFLTPEQVKQLTGTSIRKKQYKCLIENKIAFTKDFIGRPVVTVTSVEGTGRSRFTGERVTYVPSVLKAA